jgi:hypothetical protein
MNRYALLFLFLLCSFKTFAAVFSLTSPAFEANGMIPIVFTCYGANKSPPLIWQNVPTNTQSLALIAEDPDAPGGTWTHWILFNISPTVKQLNINEQLEGTALAKNSWGNSKYQGPCPPMGTHRYVFTLYALDKVLSLNNGAATNTALDAMTGHVIGSAVYTGLYQKL